MLSKSVWHKGYACISKVKTVLYVDKKITGKLNVCSDGTKADKYTELKWYPQNLPFLRPETLRAKNQGQRP